MKNKGLIATIVVLSAIIVALVVVLLAMQLSSIIPLNGNKNETSTEVFVESSTEIAPETEPIIETIEEDTIKADVKTYTSHNDRINIEYPEISGLLDSDLQEKINEKLYNNAISIVKLYPISTALQRLNITCEVRNIDENFITVLYEGRVVGDQAGGANTNLKSGSTINNNVNNSQSNTTDPYLDGFVDPLTVFPSSGTPITNVTPIEIQNNSSAVNAAPSMDKTKTADKGPTVAPSITPTSERSSNRNVVTGNSASSNPTNPSAIINNDVNSNGVYQGSSNMPINASGNTNSSSAPVYGHTGTSVSASTINQKIFYTNTIDLRTGQNVTLKDFVTDFESLAKYARSSKVEFINIDEGNRTQVRSYINKTVLSTLTEQLEKNSDFQNTNISTWPKHFSYMDPDGTIYFTIKLSSRLGNYAIIKYNK